MFMINNTEKQAIILPFTDYARQLFVSKLLEKPLSDID